ncbi:MAG: aromatic ring-hydroxylating dioxygenase subunit alpha [Alphaproteobacteria bacterium]|nr:aromatic ring-hydroxylating dioxygenase subunit alpha [Alphaproteobacteria bacterium]
MSFLHNHWYAAALSAEIGEAPFARRICDEAIVLFRTASGELAALEDRCAHRHAPLSMGSLKGEAIECCYHGLRYGSDGRCVHVPGQAQIPPRLRVRSYRAIDRHGWVWLWIGDAEAADPDGIPEFHWFDDPAWSGFQLYFHVEAATQLFVDNLLDLSHVAFTHRNSIGAASAADADADLDTMVDGDVVRGRRALKNVEPGPFIGGWGNFAGSIDRTSTYIWRPPSNIEIRAEFADAGNKITIMVINPITPETATTSHFWIGWARDFALDDEALTEGAKTQNTQVIMEDVEVIEAQQRVIADNPGLRAVPINADRAVVAVHKVLERLHAEQAASQRVAAS